MSKTRNKLFNNKKKPHLTDLPSQIHQYVFLHHMVSQPNKESIEKHLRTWALSNSHHFIVCFVTDVNKPCNIMNPIVPIVPQEVALFGLAITSLLKHCHLTIPFGSSHNLFAPSNNKPIP